MTTSAPDTALGRLLVEHRLEPRRVAAVLVSLTLLLELCILAATKWGGHGLSRFFNPDAEYRFPAFYSCLLLLLAGAAGVALARRGVAHLVLGLGLLFMALDELLAIHEALENRTGVDWQLLYLPGLAVAAVVLVGVFRSARQDSPLAVPVLAVGLGCWVVAQALEALEWDGATQRAGYLPMMFSEELLEMLGTVAILVALLLVAWPASATDRRLRTLSGSTRRVGRGQDRATLS
ncbi:MAG: hypothetical protein JWP68_2663 [Modestobacter sp.]|jgi:hypothetical protein|nr:hypothetical protein [Modestobacter sp.]